MRKIYNKSGVSEVIAYVLLIVISLSIATSVYYWLKGQIPKDDSSIKCEEGVSLNIREYNYNCSTTILNVTLENRGRFNIDGFAIRVNNESRDIGIFTLNRSGTNVSLNSRIVLSYNVSNLFTDEYPAKLVSGEIKFLEVQPLLLKKGKLVFCENVISEQTIRCD